MRLSVQENGPVDHFIADKVVGKLTVYFEDPFSGLEYLSELIMASCQWPRLPSERSQRIMKFRN